MAAVSWKFEKKLRSQKGRDPVQDSFFTSESIEDDTHALVRESIQNSLDAKSQKDLTSPVLVRFGLGSLAQSSTIDSYISSDAWEHFNADGNGLNSPPKSSDECKYLVFEDFNTTGLIGSEQESEPSAGNAFCYFMRAEGQSGKEDGDRGRHGIGKFVFPKTSKIRSFFISTVREDDQRCLIAGQTILKSHYIGEDRYTPDGWWGTYTGDEHDKFQLPVEDANLFQQMKEDFGLARTSDQPGLSVIIPFVDEKISLKTIADYAIREYFYPILTGELVIQLSDDDDEIEINNANLKENVKDLMSHEAFKAFEPVHQLALKTLDDEQISHIELPIPNEAKQPLWSSELITKELASEISSILNDGRVLRVKVPIYVQLQVSDFTSESHFNIYITRDLQERAKKVLFIREGISIPEEKSPQLKGYTSIISIEKGPLATLLGDSENPAHTEWEKNASRFKNKYKWGAKTIDFVRNSVQKLLNLLNQADDELDKNVLADIFWIEEDEDKDQDLDARKQKKPKKGQSGGGGQPDIEIERRPRYYKISKLADGFRVMGDPDFPNKERYFRIRAAYDLAGASKKKVLKLYHKNDFDLGSANANITSKNLRQIEANLQEVSFLAKANNFEITMRGFDPNRDILVDVESRELSDEEI